MIETGEYRSRPGLHTSDIQQKMTSMRFKFKFPSATSLSEEEEDLYTPQWENLHNLAR